MRNLMLLAKWLAGRADIDVVLYQGSTACIGLANGRRVIRIPSHWSYSDDPQASVLLEGIIDHEALGHGRFSDLEGRQKAEDAGLIKFNQMSAGIQNILEDVFIENKAIETYPGVKANLSKMIEILVGRNFFGHPDLFGQAQKPQLLMIGLLNILRSRLIPGQRDLLKVNTDALEALLPSVLGQIWVDVLAIGMEVEHSKSTADNIDLTIRIMDLLKSASEQEPPQAPPEGEGGDPTDDAESESDDSSNDESEPENSESDPTAQEPEDQSDSTPEEEGQKASSCTGDEAKDGELPEDVPGDDDAESDVDGEQSTESESGSKFSEEEIQIAKEIIDSQDQEIAETEIGDAISEILQKMVSNARVTQLEVSDAVCSVSDSAMRVCSKVKSISDELQDALVAETRSEKSTKFVGKSLNSRVLSRVKMGNARVFRQKIEGIGLSSAISILVDFSGSMGTQMLDGVSRLDGAIGLVYGLGDILDEFDIPFEINGYSDRYATMKAFSEDWSQIRRKKEAPGISGGTYTGIAMQKALGNLVVRQEDRKQMIVITDGDTSDLPVLMSCYSEAKEMGIDIASVMIGPNAPSIEILAKKFGFKAVSTNLSAGLGRFTVDRILESI